MKPIPRVALDDNYPQDIARRFRAACRPNLIHQNGIWYDYTGTYYAEIEGATLDSAMQTFMGDAVVGKLALDGKTMSTPVKDGIPKPFAPTSRDVQEAVRSLAMLKEVHKAAATYRSPSWLDNRYSDPLSILPCQNGLFDLESRKLLDHTPEFFCTYCLPLNYDPSVPVPKKWLRTLLQIYGGRKHLVRAQQEVDGYLISGDRSREKFIWHRGLPRSGKGLIGAVERALVGPSNTVSFSIGGSESTLGEKHGLQGAENALLIQIPDAGARMKISTAASTRLKEISGGDAVPVRPLYGKTASMILPGLIVGNSNAIPNFGTDADALAARGLFFPHDVSFRDNPDVTLKNPRKSPLLTVEALTGILNWAIAGLDRLNGRGRFEEWIESFELKRLMLRESNAVVACIDSECELKTGAYVEKTLLHHVYRDWCAAQGEEYVIENYFSGRLQRAVSTLGVELRDRRARADDDSRPRDWVGIRLTEDNRIKYYERDAALYGDLIGLGYEEREAALTAIKTEPHSGRPIAKPWTPSADERAHDYSAKEDFEE
jgi:putative DNA primase/helicase